MEACNDVKYRQDINVLAGYERWINPAGQSFSPIDGALVISLVIYHRALFQVFED